MSKGNHVIHTNIPSHSYTCRATLCCRSLCFHLPGIFCMGLKRFCGDSVCYHLDQHQICVHLYAAATIQRIQSQLSIDVCICVEIKIPSKQCMENTGINHHPKNSQQENCLSRASVSNHIIYCCWCCYYRVIKSSSSFEFHSIFVVMKFFFFCNHQHVKERRALQIFGGIIDATL